MDKAVSIDENYLPVYIHMAKTGGTSVNRVAAMNYGLFQVISIAGRDSHQSMARLTGPKKHLLEKASLVQGHSVYGLHSYTERPIWYFTFLREPVKRSLSSVRYISSTPKHSLYRKIQEKGYKELFLDGSLVDNSFCRALLPKERRKDSKNLTEADYMNALQVLREKIGFVGFVENFDVSMGDLARCLGWKYSHGIRRNTTLDKVAKEDVDMDFIADFEKYDLRLYQEARRLFPSSGAESHRTVSGRWIPQWKYAISRLWNVI